MLRKFFFFLNALALIVLLLSCMAVYINPNQFWQLSFIGFAFPVVLVVNVFFLLLWIIKRSKFAFVSLIAIGLSWKFIHSSFAFHYDADKEQGVKLMTWNVKNFDLYNWTRNNLTRPKMMALIKEQNPDVLCMQEFYTNDKTFYNLEYLRDTLGYKYVFFPPSVEFTRAPQSKVQKLLWHGGLLTQKWGVAIFCKYPIMDTGQINFKKTISNDCIYIDLNVNGKPLRIYNVHFQSIHLGYEDYATLDELEQTQQTRWTSIKSILRKMKKAYAKRSEQANAVARHMQQFKGAKIVCGDFNDVPVSYSYNTTKQNLQDAFVEKGRGFGSTYANKFSIFRIDHAFFDPAIQINSYNTIRQPLSDHYPVCVTFSL